MSNPSTSFHLSLAKSSISQFLKKGDCVIDATCGNGHDTLFLAQLILTDDSGHVYGYDIQEQALDSTRLLLKNSLSKSLLDKITLFHKSHENFSDIPSSIPIRLIVYNLGYLPKGDKSITTLKETSLKSIQNGLKKISPKGALCITCYPGHAEGKQEEKMILDYLKTLPKEDWKVLFHQQLNRPLSPSFIWLESLI